MKRYKLPLERLKKYIKDYKPNKLESEVLNSRPKEFLEFVRLLYLKVVNGEKKVNYHRLLDAMETLLETEKIHPYFLTMFVLDELDYDHLIDIKYFTHEQITLIAKFVNKRGLDQIIQGFQDGLTIEQIQFYAKPEFSEWQIREIRLGFKISKSKNFHHRHLE